MKKEQDTLTILDYLRRNIPAPKQEREEEEEVLPPLEEDEDEENPLAPKKESLFS